MVIGADHFMLVLLKLLLLSGVLVLLYQCTHYASRGGCSDRGNGTGTFFVLANGETSWFDWFRGAALSFKLIASYYTRRGGYSGRDVRSGAFCVYADGGFTWSNWDCGAALL